jgi:hypothetical protein
MTIWHMGIACSIPNATNTHSEYEIHLFHDNSVFAKSPLFYCTCIACFAMVTQLVSEHKHIKLMLFQSTILRKIFIGKKRLETICTLGKTFNQYLVDQIQAGIIDWELSIT